MRVVPTFDEIEDGHLCLGLGLEVAAVQQLAFQRGEEAFAQGVIETVADRTHRGSYARLDQPLEGLIDALDPELGLHLGGRRDGNDPFALACAFGG